MNERSLTPPPWAASDRAVSERAKEAEARDTLAALVLDLRTLASDWNRFPWNVEDPSRDLLAVLRRYGLT